MNIIQVNSHYAFSSIGRTTTEMHEYLCSRGHNSFVFCMNKSDESNNIFKVVNKIEYRLNGLHSRITGLQSYSSCIPTYLMLNRWKKIKPDVVILRNIHSDFVNFPMIMRFCIKRNLPVVIVLHDVWFFTGHCTYYTKIKCDKWQRQCDNCPGLKEGNPSWFFDTSKRAFKDKYEYFQKLNKLAVIGVSNWVASEAKKSPMFTKAQIVKGIYNWINIDVFKPKDTKSLKQLHNINNEFVILGIAQNWIPAKGLFILIDIAKHFPDCKVIIVGNLKKEYKQLMPSNVDVVGVLSDTSLLADYYSLGDVFINPSIQDTFGKVTAEALACGTPVVANDATGTPEVVGDCGYIVHNNDMKMYFDGINQVRHHGKTFYSKKCVERVKTFFEKNKNLGEYMELFTQLVR